MTNLYPTADLMELEGTDREELDAWMLKFSDTTIKKNSDDEVVLSESYTLIDFV